jgi:hypothetical protein
MFPLPTRGNQLTRSRVSSVVAYDWKDVGDKATGTCVGCNDECCLGPKLCTVTLSGHLDATVKEQYAEISLTVTTQQVGL